MTSITIWLVKDNEHDSEWEPFGKGLWNRTFRGKVPYPTNVSELATAYTRYCGHDVIVMNECNVIVLLEEMISYWRIAKVEV